MNTPSSDRAATAGVGTAERKTIYLEECDQRAIAAIRASYGLRSDAGAIRLALRLFHGGEMPLRAATRDTEGAQ